MYGSLEIESTPLKCNVYLDNKLMGETPLILDKVLVGNHSIRLEKDGYLKSEDRIELEEGKTDTRKYTLQQGELHEYVDLGLSVKWATCNVGASKPEEYGDYYAWGETETKSTYNWSTYKYCNGSSSTMTKYCSKSSYGNNGFTDSKTTLEMSDDVARSKWGGSWRMPTKDEFSELSNSDNCTWTWTTRNGINGYLVTSKKSGHEGASIFLPATGFRNDTNLDYVGSLGNYWSSSLLTDYPNYARNLFFNSDNNYFTNYYSRYHGLSVRPVCP